jgi:hypothetical protein
MLRRLLIALLVVVVAAVVAADRVGAHVAAHVLAGKLETDEHLSSRPSVSIGGIPFLTQAFAGKYSDITVTAHDFTTTDGVPVQTLSAKLHGVHVPLSKVIHGSVKQVPVDRVDGRAFVSFDGLARYLAGHGAAVRLKRASATSVEVIRRISAGKRTASVDGIATIRVSSDVVTLSVGRLTVNGLGSQPVPVAPYLLQVPLRALPFRFSVTSVTVTDAGIAGTGVAHHVVLGS